VIAVLESLTGDELLRLAEAGRSLARFEAEMRAAGENPVSMLTKGSRLVPFRHYPEGDVYDFATHSQFYFHAHRGNEKGHVHLFLRPRGMPAGICPEVAVPGDKDAPCHLVAVGMDERGRVEELFTTNRWVTGEAWYAAADIARMLPGFSVAMGPYRLVGQWLTALVSLYRPVIGELAVRRDASVALWRGQHPDRDALDDAGLEVTSRQPVDVAAWTCAVESALKR
jgi:hypothetical protein